MVGVPTPNIMSKRLAVAEPNVSTEYRNPGISKQSDGAQRVTS
jgi:hypothetical protein